jgi:hypothetical protein
MLLTSQAALEFAHEGAESIVTQLVSLGYENTKIVQKEDSWALYIEDAFITESSAEDPVEAVDTLYERVVELFVTGCPNA